VGPGLFPRNWSELTPVPQQVEKAELLTIFARGAFVLDCGCVAHTAARALEPSSIHSIVRAAASRVVGIDVLAKDLAQLLHRGFTNLCCANAEHLPFLDCFDVVIAGDIIEHLSCPGSFLRSVWLALKPGGTLVITTPNPFYINQFLSIVASNQITVNDEHTCWFDPQTLTQLATRHGFDVASVHWLLDTWGNHALAPFLRVPRSWVKTLVALRRNL